MLWLSAQEGRRRRVPAGVAPGLAGILLVAHYPEMPQVVGLSQSGHPARSRPQSSALFPICSAPLWAVAARAAPAGDPRLKGSSLRSTRGPMAVDEPIFPFARTRITALVLGSRPPASSSALCRAISDSPLGWPASEGAVAAALSHVPC